MSGRALVLALVVVLAGCASVSPADMTETTATGDAGTQAAGTPTVDPDNPWGEATLTVGIETENGDDRAYAPLVQEALDYWEAHAEEYAGYPISYELDPDAENPDLRIRFVEKVTACKDIEEAAGCAPYITKPGQVSRPEEVEVMAGLSDQSTVLVVKHELGHMLGLDHDDDPQSVMSAKEHLTTLPMRNASERELPWRNATLSVFVDYSQVSSSLESDLDAQVQHALDYYDRGEAGYVPENVSFVRTKNVSRADVVISFPKQAPCGGGAGSCGSRAGVDLDGDGELEYYTSAEITVSGVDPEAVGWHVGYWLGYALGFSEVEQWPPVFRDASAEDRRGEWWENESTASGSAPAIAV